MKKKNKRDLVPLWKGESSNDILHQENIEGKFELLFWVLQRPIRILMADAHDTELEKSIEDESSWREIVRNWS